MSISMNANKFYPFSINVSFKYNFKKKKKPMPQAIGLISSDPAWNNSFCSAFLCVCVCGHEFGLCTVLLAAKLQSVWQEFLGWTPHYELRPKNHMLSPLNTRQHHQKKPLHRFSSCKLFWVGSIYLIWTVQICRWWLVCLAHIGLANFLDASPAFDTPVQMGKPGPLLVQNLGLGNVNTTTYPFYWTDHWTGPDQPSW